MTETHPFEWNEPIQQRSKAKVARILETARAMALEQGSLDLKMTELAKRSGVAIGTLYQFFPSRTALIAKLFATEMEPIDARIGNVLTGAQSLEDLGTHIEAELRTALQLVHNRPGLHIIWGSATLDPAIEQADYENTRRNAEVLTDTILPLLAPGVDRADVAATALLICHLWGSVVRLCLLSGKAEQDRIIQQYARMLAAHGAQLAQL